MGDNVRQLASSQFRVTYHILNEPVEVTVLGRVIGRYIPTYFGARYWEPVEPVAGEPVVDEVISEDRITIIPKETP